MPVPSLGQYREGGRRLFCQVLLVQRQKFNCYPPFPPSLGARLLVSIPLRLTAARGLTASLAETLRVEQPLRAGMGGIIFIILGLSRYALAQYSPNPDTAIFPQQRVSI